VTYRLALSFNLCNLHKDRCFWFLCIDKRNKILFKTNQIIETPRERAMRVVRQLITDKLRDIPSRVYLMGSCARGDNSRYSDIDIAIETLQSAPKTLISDIRDLLEQSDVPFLVDIFDFSQLEERYQKEIKKEGVLWIAPP
jgi:predicted nucleotidyltransferase